MKKSIIALAVVFVLSFTAFLGLNKKVVSASEEKSFGSYNYTTSGADFSDTVDHYGLIIESGQVTFQTDGYDGAANGGYLTYKIEAEAGKVVDTLKVAMVGNRLGSFGKGLGMSENYVDFKPYISTNEEFGEPIETITLPASDKTYNLDYDFSNYLGEEKSGTYYVKLWFGSSNPGSGFYYDWFQLGTIDFTGTETTKIETKNFGSYNYTVSGADFSDTVDHYGLIIESGQVSFQTDGYDGAANGGYLTYKIEAEAGKVVDTLKVAMVGNRLGSFGKGLGMSENYVDFKPYISTNEDFGDPIETITLPASDKTYNLDYDFSNYLGEEKSGTYYVKLWFGSSNPGSGFYYDWFQLGTINFTGTEEDKILSYNYGSYNYTVSGADFSDTVDNYGLVIASGQVSFQSDGYDGAANGGYLTYKVEADEGFTVESLKVAMVGNRLGSFGKGLGMSENYVDFKPYISTTEEFGEPIETITLPASDKTYNLDYDFSNYLGEEKSRTYYVKLWFGSSNPGSGFYYDWFQLGTVSFTGTEKDTGVHIQQTDASGALLAIDSESYERTGSEIRPDVKVTLGDLELALNTDYTVAYSDNVKIGTATITVTFKGLYKGTATKTFEIIKDVAKDYDDSDLHLVDYTPDQFDFVDYYGGCGDIDEAYGDGVTTFAHAGLTVPLKGREISLMTNFKLLAKTDTENGGDGVDGWLTYSFSSTPAESGNDKTFPYYGGSKSGYFLHVTNYSSTDNPNDVEVRFVKCIDGATSDVDVFHMYGAVENSGALKNDAVTLCITLTRGEECWTLKIYNADNETVYAERNYDILDESLFINEKGQTFFSTAIYEGAGCDGEHWNHRGVNVFSFKAYTKNADGAIVTLDKDSYEYEEGVQYKPAVTVTLNGETLVFDKDYYYEYSNNTKVGTATVKILFINDYAGSEAKEVNFTIAEKKVEPTDPIDDDKDDDKEEETKKKGCKGSVAGSLIFVSLAAALVIKKRKAE